MKFHSFTDKQQFLLEINYPISNVREDLKISSDMMELFLKKRSSMLSGLKNFRKSQIQKRNWRVDRWKFMKGIKRFHRSTQGKRFHRELGRFLATHMFNQSPLKTLESFPRPQFLSAISSLKTHAFIELEYYMPVQDQEDYEFFIEELIKFSSKLEESIVSLSEFKEDDMEFLLRLVENSQLMKEVSNHFDINVEKVLESVSELTDEDTDFSKPNFYNECFNMLIGKLVNDNHSTTID